MKIRDPIHGLIEVGKEIKDVIDSYPLQRLRWVHQTSMNFLVYPGMRHSRFEHSVGVMFLAGKIASVLDWDIDNALVEGLLHDIGHPSFSHDGEYALQREGIIKDHESEGLKIRKEYFPEFPQTKEEKVVSFSLGADRMDYLLRDSYYAGVKYGVVEYDYIINNLVSYDGEICVDKKTVEAVESLFIARFHMFKTVYMHKTARIVSAMLVKGLRNALREGFIGKEDLYERGDLEIIDKLKGIDIFKKIKLRRLYKFFKEVKMDDKSFEELEELSLDYPFVVHRIGKLVKGYDVKIFKNNKTVDFSSVSPIVRFLRSRERKEKNVIIAVEKGKSREVYKLLKEEGFFR